MMLSVVFTKIKIQLPNGQDPCAFRRGWEQN